MGFRFPDLIVESIIRDGLERVKADNTLLDDVFEDLTAAYADRKYGSAEIDKIKTLINEKNIAVVHSFHEGAAKSPCYSIQLGMDGENKQEARLGDLDEELQEQIVDPVKLDALKRVDNLIPTAYDPLTGKVSVPDTADMSMVRKMFIYEDGAGTEFEVLSGISNTPGNKFFFIAKDASPDIVNEGFIRTFLDFTQIEIRGVTHDVKIMLGVHTKEALLTKYLYTLLKYFILSRKDDIIKRGFFLASLSGSDFTRDLVYEGDMVFNRFLTVSGKVEDMWRSDDVELIDSVVINATAVDEC